MPTEANSINAATTGIVGNTGTGFTGTAVTQYNVLTGAATSSTLNNVAPSATSGVALISQGNAAQPIFGTVAIAGGGTNATSFTQTNGIVVYNGTSLVNYAGPQINSSGIATNGTQPIFSAVCQSSHTNVTGDGTVYTVVFDSKEFDVGTNYNATTGIFTAPVSGEYLFTACIDIIGLAAGNTTGSILFVATGVSYYLWASNPYAISAGGSTIISGSKIINMTAGNTMKMNLTINGGTKIVGVYGDASANRASSFQGFLLC